ncbi:Hypothetical protein GbCGDNIH3_7058 [Granulibacter bethesdensis]|uniref:Uncharacterized protein n=1 Tax=Granulibacter bethesdensis TaxID=364410 RepID=A0AAN0RE22_9PROT|nr:Hypothetical protein GbCGDNIH3_7058 [Granulibacter bethesdensis]
MTPARFHQILDLIHWSGRGLAAILTCDERMVRRWGAGTTEIPPIIAEWLEALAATHVAYPPPAPGAWQRRARPVREGEHLNTDRE